MDGVFLPHRAVGSRTEAVGSACPIMAA
jgi:hypothetical protein